jgi:hypothetical protein
MSKPSNSLLSSVMPRQPLAQTEANSASRFVLDEAKFLADIMNERCGVSGRSANPA